MENNYIVQVMRKFNKLLWLKLCLFSFCSFELVGCAVFTDSSKTERSITENEKEAMAVKNRMNHNYITYYEGAFIGDKIVKINKKTNYPAEFYLPLRISKNYTSFDEFALNLYQLTGFHALLEPLQVAGSYPQVNLYFLQFQGNLLDLLNYVGAKYNLSWEFDADMHSIIFSQTQTKTWQINSIPGDSNSNSTMTMNSGVINAQNGNGGGNGGGGYGGGGGGGYGGGGMGGLGGAGGSGAYGGSSSSSVTQTVNFTSSANLWTSIESSISRFLSPRGTYSISQATSSVTVSDYPNIVNKVNAYIQQMNAFLSKQISLEVKIVEVDLEQNNNVGISWNLVFGNIQTNTIANSSSGFIVSPSAANVNSSQLIVNSLSEFNKTSVTENINAITHNNQAVPLQSVDQLSFINSVMVSQVAQVGSTTGIYPSVLTTGISLYVLPVIEANNTINMQVSINLSSLKNMNQFNAGNGLTLQLPNVLQRSLQQKVSMRDGDTLVLSGFEQYNNTFQEQGALAANNWILGGGEASGAQHQVLVILITPHILNVNN